MDTQRDRALRLYRRLLVLERVFRNTNGTHHEQETSASEDSLREGIQSMLAELAEDARIVSTVPHPRSDRPQGDDHFDDRSEEERHPLSHLERREIQQIVRAYEELIDYFDSLKVVLGPTDGKRPDINWHRLALGRFKSENTSLLTGVVAGPAEHTRDRRTDTRSEPVGTKPTFHARRAGSLQSRSWSDD